MFLTTFLGKSMINKIKSEIGNEKLEIVVGADPCAGLCICRGEGADVRPV